MVLAFSEFLARHTLESPWWLAAGLVILAAVVQVVAQQRGSRRGSYLALGAVGLAVLAVVLSFAIETPREAVMAKTRALVDAAGPFDAAVFGGLVAEDASLRGPDGTLWATLPQVESGLDRLASGSDTTHKVLGLSVEDVNLEVAGGSATAWLDLRTTGNATSGVPVFTTWEIVWQRDAEGAWAAERFRWVRFNQQAPSRGMMP